MKTKIFSKTCEVIDLEIFIKLSIFKFFKSKSNFEKEMKLNIVIRKCGGYLEERLEHKKLTAQVADLVEEGGVNRVL